MKKLLTVLALTLMTVVMAFTVAGCSNTSAVDKLTERIEALEKENEDLQNQLNNLNVFWTDKKVYSKTETITIYFGQIAAFRIRVDNFEWVKSSYSINNDIYLTSLCSDILEDSIAFSTYLIWDNGTYLRDSSTTDKIAKQNEETRVGGNYKGDRTATAYNNATFFDFVICVPGTPFELARFKNVTVNK